MRSSPIVVGLVGVLSLVLPACGQLEYNSSTYKRVNKTQTELPWMAIGAHRTREGSRLFSEQVTIGAPYSLGFGRQYEDATTEPFAVRAVRVAHAGVEVFVLSEGDGPLVATPREKTNPERPAMVTRVPLPELTFVADSEVVVEAEVRMPGGDAWVAMHEAFSAESESKTYSGCDRIAMY